MSKLVRLVSLMCSFCFILLILGVPLCVSAADEHNVILGSENDAVTDIITQIGELRAQEISNALNSNLANSRTDSGIQAEISKLENELVTNYHVEILGQEEVERLISRNNVIRVKVPTTTSTVKWYSYSTDYMYGGETYHVQRVYAQGRNSSSTLCGVGVGVKLYDQRGVVVENETTLCSVYAQKAIGLVPILRLTPYEMLAEKLGTLDAVVNEACSVTYSYTGTACFTYVYPENKGEDFEKLTHVSTSFSVAATFVNAGIIDEEAYSVPCPKNFTISATNYASVSEAVLAYPTAGSSCTYSYVPYYSFHDEDNRKLLTVNLTTPASPLDVG